MRFGLLVCAVAAAVLASACAAEGRSSEQNNENSGMHQETRAPANSNADDVAEALRGRTFVAQSLVVDGSQRPIPGVGIQLEFQPQRLLVLTGCNSFFTNGPAGYSVRRDRLLLDEPAWTMMGCDPPFQELEKLLQMLLVSEPLITVDRNELEVASGSVRLTALEAGSRAH